MIFEAFTSILFTPAPLAAPVTWPFYQFTIEDAFPDKTNYVPTASGVKFLSNEMTASVITQFNYMPVVRLVSLSDSLSERRYILSQISGRN